MVTLGRAGILELIGLSWYFVRVHDAVQVCVSLLQSNTSSEVGSSAPPSLKRGSYERIIHQDRDPWSPNPVTGKAPWRREGSESDTERASLISSVDDTI